MPTFISFFSYSHDAARAMTDDPSDRVAAAVAMAAASTGATARWETHQVFDGAAQAQIQQAARTGRDGYRPPTA